MCTEKHYFICQHHLTTVNEKDRVNIYNKWNETYPHQTANEVVIYVKGNIKRNPVAVTTLKSEVTTVKSIDDSFVLNSRNSDLHPVHNSHAVFHQQVNMKPKKRHSVLKLTGEVNLGIDKRERKRGNKQQSHLQKPDKPVEKIIGTTTRRSTTTSTVSSTTIPTTTTEYLSPTTTQKSSTTISNSARIERLKQRLAKLSPEDKNSFLQMKRERVETKKKYNQTVET